MLVGNMLTRVRAWAGTGVFLTHEESGRQLMEYLRAGQAHYLWHSLYGKFLHLCEQKESSRMERGLQDAE